jgi:hypothetical protein
MRLLTKILILSLLVLSPQLVAQWNPDPNSPKQIVTASVSPQNLHSVKDGNEGFFLVWEDAKEIGKSKILFNHYNLRGEVARSSNGVEVANVTNSQSSPEVSEAVSGKVSVIWIEEIESGKTSLMAQQINSKIDFLWETEKGSVLAASSMGNISESSVALDRKLNTQIAYIAKDANSSNYLVMAQRIDRNGTVKYGEGLVVEKGTDQKSSIHVLVTPSGGANICWVDVQGSRNLIRFALVDSSGKLVGEPAIIATVDGTIKSFLAVTLSNGDQYLVWESTGRAKEISHQLVNYKGELKWSKGGKQAVSNQGINSSPVAIDGSDATIILSWINSSGGDEDIFLQKFDKNGNSLWGINGSTIGKIKGRQFSQTLDGDTKGGVYITWLDRREGKTEIYANKFSTSGKEEWDEEGVPVSKSSNPEKSYLEIFYDGKDGVVLVFKEKNKSDEGIYGQRISGIRQKVQGIVEAWLTTTDDEVKINWTATNEKSVISYFVHRMEPRGKDTAWTEIDNVVADPNAQGAYYTFDSPDKEGQVVYRITQISKDNKVVSQKMVQVDFVRKTNQKVYVSQNVPNPFSGETIITYNVSGVPSVKFEFYDAAFKLVKEETVKIAKEGKYTYTFNSAGFQPGIYFFRFTAGTYVEVKKMAIIN